MHLIDLPLPPKLQALLASIEGLVVDHVIFQLQPACADPPVDVFRHAARRTIERVIESGENRSPNRVLKPGGGAQVNEAALARALPTTQTWSQFLGGFWNASEQQVQDSGSAGYVHAFAHPPYGLRLPKPEQSRVICQVLQLLLNAEMGDDRVTILSWPTNWSWYFDDGRAWWGSYCWTLWLPNERIVGIAASYTD